MALVYCNLNDIPVLFPIESGSSALVSASRLSVRFSLKIEMMCIEEEVRDSVTGLVVHYLEKLPNVNTSMKEWSLPVGRYKVFGFPLDRKEVLLAASNNSVGNVPSSNTILLASVKVEPSTEDTILLTDDSDASSPIIERSSLPKFDKSISLETNESEESSFLTNSVSLPIPSSSVFALLKHIPASKGSRNIFRTLDYERIPHNVVEYLPSNFNGDVIFELPPLSDSSLQSQAGMMKGMDKRYDGHIWTKTMTSNIKNIIGLKFRTSNCVGHLRCTYKNCEYLDRVHRSSAVKETEWEGVSSVPFFVGEHAPLSSSIVCKICKAVPTCIAPCSARIYYIFAKRQMTRVCAHFGTHNHPVKLGYERQMIEKTRSLVEEQVQRIPFATTSSIVLEVGKDLLSEMLLQPEGDEVQVLDLHQLGPVFEKCRSMTSPNIRNDIVSFRNLRRFGVMDSITKLRGCSKWAFVQESKFPGQVQDDEKVFVFKMSEVGPGSGVDLVRRMQGGGDLQEAWVMFDHVKRVKQWTTMACHVYDSILCKVLTIAVSDMQSEDAAAQKLFWINLNSVCTRNGISSPNFRGFMADSAQANWNAVRQIYGSGDPTIPMPNRERTCLFHWVQSLEKHTKADIRQDLQNQHRMLCRQYKNGNSLTEAETRYLAIRSWWHSSGAATGDAIKRLELWLAFWHFRYTQWGEVMQPILTSAKHAEMPSCNLAESIHNKWLQQSGNRGGDLYVATVDDYVRAFMQVVQVHRFLQGEQGGHGPGKEELKLRAAQRSAVRSGDPAKLSAVLQGMSGVEGFCTRQPHFEGDEVFGSSKRKADIPLGAEVDSHRPDKVNFSRPCIQLKSAIHQVVAGSSATHLSPVQEDTPAENELADVQTHIGNSNFGSTPIHVTSIQESACDERLWHIARLPSASSKACFAMQAGTKKKCTAKIVQGNHNTAAPTYTGSMENYKKDRVEEMQFFFCNDDINRCVKGIKRKWVKSCPDIPDMWPVKLGTNLGTKEILAFEHAGFQLPARQVISPRRLFGECSSVPAINMFPTPPFPDEYPKSRGGKSTRRSHAGPTTTQANNCASSCMVVGRILQVTSVPHPGFGCVVSLNSEGKSSTENYMMTIGSFPACTCPYFSEMLPTALGKRGQFSYCKHLYFMFLVVCALDPEIDIFMHAPTFSFSEVKRLLLSPSLAKCKWN